MLQASDVMAAKIAVQLRIVGDQDARAILRAMDAQPASNGDFVNRIALHFRLDPRVVETVRHRVALYNHVRAESVYLRLMEKELSISRQSVATLLAQLEGQAHRRRLGEALVRAGKLSQAHDTAFMNRARESIAGDDTRVLERYRREDFAGVAKPLIRGSNLDPSDFKISTLFRGKETQALVDQIDLNALREEARRAAEGRGRIEAPTPVAPSTTEAENRLRTTARGTPALPMPTPAPRGAVAPAGPIGMDQVSKMKRIADYAIVETLGVGGMGAVFLGQKDGRGEYCAIKVMLNQAAGETEMGRFRREIQLTKKVNHPNVIGIMDAGETPEGLTYFTVPALAGKELRALMDANAGKGLDPRLVVKIFKQVLDGMEAVHKAKIIHRDLKPENIFIRAGGDDDVKIMDFGLAKSEGIANQEDCFRSAGGDVVGSPAYIAPESITNDEIDARTDIYSLGIILFEMLTGRLPLESETAQGFLSQHLICPPLTLAEAQPERRWPNGLDDLLQKMMAKTRQERPASCAEILEAFKPLSVPLLRVDAPKTAPAPMQAISPFEIAAAEAAALAARQAAEQQRQQAAYGFKGLLGRLMGRK
jgi:hypothetical protein